MKSVKKHSGCDHIELIRFIGGFIKRVRATAHSGRFSSACGIPQQRERVTVDGLGAIGNKPIDKSGESGIMSLGSDNMAEFNKLGRINTQPLEKEFGKLKTDEIVVTDERLEHIRNRHPEDFELFEQYGTSTVETPDLIIRDEKSENTVFMVKRLDTTNLNVVAKLILDTDNNDYKNSVMTFYRIRDKNLKKIENRNKTLYKRE